MGIIIRFLILVVIFEGRERKGLMTCVEKKLPAL